MHVLVRFELDKMGQREVCVGKNTYTFEGVDFLGPYLLLLFYVGNNVEPLDMYIDYESEVKPYLGRLIGAVTLTFQTFHR
jgi:hypothetical protein